MSTSADATPTADVAGSIADALVAQRAWIELLRAGGASLPALDEAQWAGLVDEARRHHLTGLTYHLLSKQARVGGVPGWVLQRMRPAYLETALRNAVMFRHTAHMAQLLAQRGIPVMLLKGAHLARFVFEEPAMRNMADVDIMVPRARLSETERLFLGQGYGPTPRPDIEEFCAWSNHLAKLTRPAAPVFEVHYHIERPTSPFRVDLDGVWARSRAATLEGAPVRLMALEDLLLHLILHVSYHHRFDRSAFKGLWDIHTVIARHRDAVDWSVLVERAIDWRAAGFAYTTLVLTAQLFATPIPAAVPGGLPREREDEEIIDVVRRYMLIPGQDLPKVYIDLARSHGLLARAVLLWRHVFLPRATVQRLYRVRGEGRLLWPFYVHRFGNLLIRRGRLMLRALLRTRAIRASVDREEDRLRIQAWVKDLPGAGRPPADEPER